jgi:hypothetical protein
VYAGSSCPNYTLYPPDDLNIQQSPDDVDQYTVNSPTTLAQLIGLGVIVGEVYWAACRVVELQPAGGELLGVNAAQTDFGYETEAPGADPAASISQDSERPQAQQHGCGADVLHRTGVSHSGVLRAMPTVAHFMELHPVNPEYDHAPHLRPTLNLDGRRRPALLRADVCNWYRACCRQASRELVCATACVSGLTLDPEKSGLAGPISAA